MLASDVFQLTAVHGGEKATAYLAAEFKKLGHGRDQMVLPGSAVEIVGTPDLVCHRGRQWQNPAAAPAGSMFLSESTNSRWLPSTTRRWCLPATAA
jgi:hypothetical protein